MFEPRRCSYRIKWKTNPCVEVIIFHNLRLSVAKRKHIMDRQQKMLESRPEDGLVKLVVTVLTVLTVVTVLTVLTAVTVLTVLTLLTVLPVVTVETEIRILKYLTL